VGIIGSVLLFASVLVHELSHSLVAISRGYQVSGITLFFLGGVSEIAEEAAHASEEFWIAVVGPASSAGLP
jgi:Zn-dependent protease